MPWPNEQPPPNVSPRRDTLSRAWPNARVVGPSAFANRPLTLDQESAVSGTLSVCVPAPSAIDRGFDHQRSNSPLPLLLAQINGRTDDGIAHVAVCGSSELKSTGPLVATRTVTDSVPCRFGIDTGVNR